MAWRLSVTQGKQRGQRFELHDGDNVIGRSRKCDVTISSDALDVSGRHLVISVTGNHVEVENTGRHGTRVDNVPLTAPDVLRGGQRILLAKSTEFVLEKCGAEERERVPPQPQPQPASPAVHPPTHTTPLDDDDDDADSMVGIISDDSVDIDLPDEPDSILGPLMNEAPTPPAPARGRAGAPERSRPKRPAARSTAALDDMPSGVVDIQIGADDSEPGVGPASALPSSFRGAAVALGSDVDIAGSGSVGGRPSGDAMFDNLSDLNAPLESPPSAGPGDPPTRGFSPEAVDYLRRVQIGKELRRKLIVAAIALALLGVLAYVILSF